MCKNSHHRSTLQYNYSLHMGTTTNKDERTIENGNVVLFKRKNSDVWQARIKRLNGEWKDSSTKEKDFEKAKKAAADKYHHMKWLQDNDQVDVTAQFKDIAAHLVKQMEAEIEAGTGTANNKQYIAAINNYLIPCFKTHIPRFVGSSLRI